MAAVATLDSGQDGRAAQGDCLVRRGTLNLGTYATGGIAVTKSTFDFPVSLSHLDISQSGGYTCEWIKSTGLVKVYYGGAHAHTHTENTAGAYAQNATTAANTASVGDEVANSTNLASINFRFLAHGK